MSDAVAVVIPCRNAAAWLGEAIGSVQQQTRPAAELVVVDDGSTDASAEIAAGMGARCIRQAHSGPGAARNRGVRATRAPLVAFLDADDRFAADKLERQVAHLEAGGAVASCTDAWVLRGTRREGRKSAGKDIPAILTLERLIAGNPVCCSSVLLRREALERAGGFDEDPRLVATEDWDLWLRVTCAGAFAYLDEPLLDYRVHEGSLSDDLRFARGVDVILAKLMASAPELDDLAARIAARRAGVRLDAAWHLARRGRGRDARALLREAGQLGAPFGKRWRTWLRSFAP